MDVPCPNCRAVLRVPAEVAAASAGKRAKCKKCDHRFPLPGVPADAAANDGSVQLSEADKPAAPPTGSPFGFDEGDAVVVVRKPGSAAKHKLSADAPRPAAPAKSSKTLLLLVGGVVALVLAGVGATAAVFVLVLEPAAPVAAEAVPRKEKAKEAVKESAKAARPAGGKVPPNEAVLAPIPPPPDDNPAPDAAPAVVAKAAALVAGKAVGGVAFDKLPAPPAGPRKLVAPARVTIALDFPLDAVLAVAFSTARPQVVAVLWRSNAGFQGAGVQDTLDVYAATGARTARLVLAADGLPAGRPRLLSVSPDGRHAATELPAGKLTVFHLSRGKPALDGVDPFADAPDAKGLAVVAFLDDAHVGVLDRSGNGQSWAVATGKGVPAAPPRPKRTAFGSTFSEIVNGVAYTYVGPTATQVAMTPTAVAGLDAAQPGASAAGFNAAAGATAVALDGAGKAVAALFPGKTPADGFALLLGKPADPAPPGPLNFPAAAGPADDVRFLAGDTLVAVQSNKRTATTLLDAESRTTVAYITAAGPTVQYGDPAGRRLWWLLPDAKDAKKSRLLAASADFDDYRAILTEARAARQPVALLLTEAGIEK
jgi:predicted Zn finger-like uncharacterized protein